MYVSVCRKQLEELQQAQMLRGELSAAEQFSLLSAHDDLAQALEGAFFVQVGFHTRGVSVISMVSAAWGLVRYGDFAQ